MQLKQINIFAVSIMLGFALIILFFAGFLEFPSANSAISFPKNSIIYTLPESSSAEPFDDLFKAFKKWDSQVGCASFKEKHRDLSNNGSKISFLQGEIECGELRMNNVKILVKKWTWIPDYMDNLYSCRCGLNCLWTQSPVLADKPDALLFETIAPPSQRRNGDPLHVYMDIEAGRKRSGYEDIFIGYHAEDDVQSTYAGAFFHKNRNYRLSSIKNNEVIPPVNLSDSATWTNQTMSCQRQPNVLLPLLGYLNLTKMSQLKIIGLFSIPDTLVYWSSSRCLPQRNQLAKKILSMLPHHSFGKCLNNVGGLDRALSFYPECIKDPNEAPKWYDHLHCAMSHYKFVLAIENTMTDSYVTEKLFYALDSGSVPIYFGAPNVWDFVPPHSIIDGTQFSSMEKLASYVKSLANDPVAYAEYHAWRRCGVFGNYGKTRATSLDTLPCRLCEAVSRKNGRDAKAL